eukprot:g3707.t1
MVAKEADDHGLYSNVDDDDGINRFLREAETMAKRALDDRKRALDDGIFLVNAAVSNCELSICEFYNKNHDLLTEKQAKKTAEIINLLLKQAEHEANEKARREADDKAAFDNSDIPGLRPVRFKHDDDGRDNDNGTCDLYSDPYGNVYDFDKDWVGPLDRCGAPYIFVKDEDCFSDILSEYFDLHYDSVRNLYHDRHGTFYSGRAAYGGCLFRQCASEGPKERAEPKDKDQATRDIAETKPTLATESHGLMEGILARAFRLLRQCETIRAGLQDHNNYMNLVVFLGVMALASGPIGLLGGMALVLAFRLLTHDRDNPFRLTMPHGQHVDSNIDNDDHDEHDHDHDHDNPDDDPKHGHKYDHDYFPSEYDPNFRPSLEQCENQAKHPNGKVYYDRVGPNDGVYRLRSAPDHYFRFPGDDLYDLENARSDQSAREYLDRYKLRQEA